MTDKPRPATLKDLQAILAHAESHPASREKLVADADGALRQAGLIATPDALDFIRSLGRIPFKEGGKPVAPLEKDPLKSDAGET